MHTDIDPNLEQLKVAIQLLREWADHCHGQAVVDDLTVRDQRNDEDGPTDQLPIPPADRQAIYRYGYAVGLEDAAAFLDDILEADAA